MEAMQVVQPVADQGASQGQTTIQRPGIDQIERHGQFLKDANHPDRQRLLEESIGILSDASATIMDTIRDSISTVMTALANSSASRKEEELIQLAKENTELLQNLKTKREKFVETMKERLSETHMHLFEADGSLKLCDDQFPPLNGLLTALLLEDKILEITDSLERLLSQIIHLESNRLRRRLWGPGPWKGQTDAPLPNTIKKSQENELADTENSKEAKVTNEFPEDTEKAPPPDQSARLQLKSMRTPSQRQRSNTSQIFLKTTRWLSSTESIFALRLVVITLALSVPAVIKSSSGFFYREKGLWAVIMAQLALMPYTADLMYGILVRTAGTIVGGLIGMAAWYIGAGNGAGNPYGMSAVMAVVIVMFMWIRLFAPPAVAPATIMMAATAFLVNCYGWINTHMPSYGSAGVGYDLFWKRVVLVLVGFAATVIVNFIPRPPSANRHYRRLFAESLANARDKYALLLWNKDEPAQDLREVVEEDALVWDETLLSIMGPIKLTSLEFSTSDFDADSLGRICHLCHVINQNIAQLIRCVVETTPEDRKIIVPSTGSSNESLVADLMAVLALVQQTLKSSEPLPAVLPVPLFAKWVVAARQQLKFHADDSNKNDLFTTYNIGGERLRKYVVFINALGQSFAAVDELVLLLKQTVGETSRLVPVVQGA